MVWAAWAGGYPHMQMDTQTQRVTLSAPRQAWIQGGTHPKQTQRHGGSRKTKLKTFFCVEKQLPAALEQVLFFPLENWKTISPGILLFLGTPLCPPSSLRLSFLYS